MMTSVILCSDFSWLLQTDHVFVAQGTFRGQRVASVEAKRGQKRSTIQAPTVKDGVGVCRRAAALPSTTANSVPRTWHVIHLATCHNPRRGWVPPGVGHIFEFAIECIRIVEQCTIHRNQLAFPLVYTYRRPTRTYIRTLPHFTIHLSPFHWQYSSTHNWHTGTSHGTSIPSANKQGQTTDK